MDGRLLGSEEPDPGGGGAGGGWRCGCGGGRRRGPGDEGIAAVRGRGSQGGGHVQQQTG